jgi:hypothetical protein
MKVLFNNSVYLLLSDTGESPGRNKPRRSTLLCPDRVFIATCPDFINSPGVYDEIPVPFFDVSYRTHVRDITCFHTPIQIRSSSDLPVTTWCYPCPALRESCQHALIETGDNTIKTIGKIVLGDYMKKEHELTR